MLASVTREFDFTVSFVRPLRLDFSWAPLEATRMSYCRPSSALGLGGGEGGGGGGSGNAVGSLAIGANPGGPSRIGSPCQVLTAGEWYGVTARLACLHSLGGSVKVQSVRLVTGGEEGRVGGGGFILHGIDEDEDGSSSSSSSSSPSPPNSCGVSLLLLPQGPTELRAGEVIAGTAEVMFSPPSPPCPFTPSTASTLPAGATSTSPLGTSTSPLGTWTSPLGAAVSVGAVHVDWRLEGSALMAPTDLTGYSKPGGGAGAEAAVRTKGPPPSPSRPFSWLPHPQGASCSLDLETEMTRVCGMVFNVPPVLLESALFTVHVHAPKVLSEP